MSKSTAVKSKQKKIIKRKKFSYADVWKGLLPWKGDGVIEVVRKVVFLVAIVVFGVCAFFIFDYYYQNYKNDKIYSELRDKMPLAMSMEEIIIPPSDEDASIMPSQQYLIDQNPDTVGYIRVINQQGEYDKIDYPIVQKTKEHEKEFYLDKSFLGEPNKAGTIFLDWRNKIGLSQQSDQMIVYGHDMKDGAMFGTLRKYKEDYSYYEKYPFIQINSNYDRHMYKIFGFFIANADFRVGDVFEYYNHINFNSQEEFYEYVNGIKRRSLILTNVDVKYGDKLVALSTCSSEFDNSRFVVVGRRIRPDEDNMLGITGSSRNPNPLMPDVYYRISGGSYDSNAEFIPYG